MNRSAPPNWDEEDVVCIAVVPVGQEVDWSPGSYEPEEAVWPPEGTFLRLQAIAAQLSLPVLANLNPYVQSRLDADSCAELLSRWNEMTAAVESAQGAGWVAAIGLLLHRCTRSRDIELLIEGP